MKDTSDKQPGNGGVSLEIAEIGERYRLLAEQSAGIAAICCEGKIVFINSVGANLLGAESPGQLMGREIRDFIHHQDWDKYQELIEKLQAGESVSPAELKCIRLDGAETALAVSLVSCKYEGKWGVQIVGRDIVEGEVVGEAIKGGEAKYRTLFERTTNAIFLMRDDIFIECNPATELMFECSSKEIIGHSPFEFSPPFQPDGGESRLKGLEKINEVLAGEGQIFEWVFKRLDGSLIDCVVNLNRVYLQGEWLIWAIVRDISKRKRAESDLKESIYKFQTLFEESRDAIYISTREGKFVEVNPAMVEMLGYERRELLGMAVREIYAHTDDRKKFRETIEKIGFVRDYEIKLKRKDHSEIDCLVTATLRIGNDGSILGYQGIIRDITERRRMEEALRKSEELNRGIVENAPVGIMYLDGEGTVVYENSMMKRLMGVPEGEVSKSLGRRLEDIPKLVSAGGLVLWRRFLAGEVISGEEIEYESIYGQNKLLKIHAAPQRSSSGEVSGAVVMCEDITEFKELEQQFLQSQKMEAVGRLAGGVAHDFNNLLTAIIGNCELAGLMMAEDHPLTKNIGGIRKAADSASILTRQLLAFSRKQIMEPKVLNINNIIADMEQLLGRVIGEDIELVISLEPDLWNLKADLGQLEQVILNLVVNARDAMPGGGTLAIETQNRELDTEYTKIHTEVAPGLFVMMAISDTGYGMTDEIKSKVFDPFFTTKEPGKGTGLGLSTVYGIVKQSGGSIWVYSELGKGTIFKIYLPKVDGEGEVIGIEEVDDSMPKGDETVMVVEDEESVREMTVLILNDLGYKVFEAKSGEEAYALCQSMNSVEIDLLITDVVLPHMNGAELSDLLKKVYPQIKVVFMSAYTENSIVLRRVLKPGMPYLQKPFRPFELTQKVRAVLDAFEGPL